MKTYFILFLFTLLMQTEGNNVYHKLLFVYPETLVLDMINNVCADVFLKRGYEVEVEPKEDKIILKLFAPCNILYFPLNRSQELLETNDFDISRKVVIFIHGWNSSPHAKYVFHMASAFSCRGGYNFLALDSSAFLHEKYLVSAKNTEKIGSLLALTLKKLVKFVPLKNIHLIGHSLGSHIAGFAGRYFTNYTGLKIPRITGLDPANPCFNRDLDFNGLQHSDAEFVDVIHTNPNMLGKASPVGHVDFYPDGLNAIKPGCLDMSCSHARAYQYFIESVYPGNENNLLGKKCQRFHFKFSQCNGQRVRMGIATPKNTRGIYYVPVNAGEPYGNNPNKQQIKCEEKTKGCDEPFEYSNANKLRALELCNTSKEVLLSTEENLNTSINLKDICFVMRATPVNFSKFLPSVELFSITLYTISEELSFPLANFSKIIMSPYFGAYKNVAILITGWLTDSDYVSDMAGAFNCREDYTFLAISISESIDNLYTWNSYDTESIGILFSKILLQIWDYNPTLNIHLIGHSLGAHIAGYAGHYYSLTTKSKILRITGLDPANPCFGYGKTLTGLQKGQAQFIDVIHTNPGGFGKTQPLGDVDFYAEGLNTLKPGCTKFGCSHNRAYDYFIESIYPGNEHNFMAVRCHLDKFSRVCNGHRDPMGLAAPTNVEGIYFFSVNAEAPYGKNKDELNEKQSNKTLDNTRDIDYLPVNAEEPYGKNPNKQQRKCEETAGGCDRPFEYSNANKLRALELCNTSKEVLLSTEENLNTSMNLKDICFVMRTTPVNFSKFLPSAESFSITLYTIYEELSFPLANFSKIIMSPYFGAYRNVAILITGWLTDSDYVSDMAGAFNCREDYTFLAISTSESIDNLYTWNSYDTESIGILFSKILLQIWDYNPTLNIHLIGHSLGAHIAGYAGHYYSLTTKSKILRITGLDPANPCFGYGQTLTGLQKGQAQFIDVIHTNPGGFGKTQPLGDVDFYAEGLNTLKPGCTKFGCSHNRAYDYFIESIYPGNEHNFMASSCTHLDKYNRVCNGHRDPMGLAAPTNLEGIYFVSVNAEAPYGKNENLLNEKRKRKAEVSVEKYEWMNSAVLAGVAIFNASKKVILDMPEDSKMSVSWEDMCLAIGNITSFNSNYLPSDEPKYLTLYTPYKNLNFLLNETSKITKSPYYDANKKVAILITGWLTDADYVSDMADAFHCRGDYNFLVFSTSSSIDNLYTWNSYDTQRAGYFFSLNLIKIFGRIPAANIHLIGHSLGAHIAGYAGHYYSLFTKSKIPRITGLDPADPCFSYGKTLTGLQKGQAQFIDVIHTNPGGFGKTQPLGDVDFYAEGLNTLKPGCTKFGCSHNRAYDYFIESIYPGNEHNFMAVRCDLDKFSRVCNGHRDPMGLAAPTNVEGIYFFSVNAEAPYGKNKDELNEKQSNKTLDNTRDIDYLPVNAEEPYGKNPNKQQRKCEETVGGCDRPFEYSNANKLRALELCNTSKEVLLSTEENLNTSMNLKDICFVMRTTPVNFSKFLPSAESFSITLYTIYEELSFPLANFSKIIMSPYFGAYRNVAILITGWLTDSDYVSDMAGAFNCREDYTFLAISTSESIDNLYTWNSYDTESIGILFSKILLQIWDYNPTLNIHLIGHSLGAHIAGYAGHYYSLTTKSKILRITGLDPANPCFGYGQTLTGLQKGQAQFIDVIHTNPGDFGKTQPLGDVDFYAEGLNTLKPGRTKFGCSHNRAYDYFIESIYPGNEHNFMASSCTHLDKYSRICNGHRDPMGLAPPTNLEGIYFVSVNAEAPYGKNENLLNEKRKRKAEVSVEKHEWMNSAVLAGVAIFNASKKVILNMPEDSKMSVSWEDMCLAIGNITSFNSNYLPSDEPKYLTLYTPYKNLNFLLNETSKITKSPYYDANKKVAILITGWLTEADYVSDMADAFHCRGDYNFLVFSTSSSIDNLYTWNSYDTQRAGYFFSLNLIKIFGRIPAANIHLIGHSLGAHIAGYAGHYYSLFTKSKIPRITGLDPADPCFSYGKTLTGLQKGQAKFVDVIHTNPGVLGKAQPLGDVDFYAEGLNTLKPGCIKFGCSHNRAYDYFIESIYPGDEFNFLANSCLNISKHSHICRNRTDPMGLEVPHDLKGLYYFSVNTESPYGKNYNGLNIKCVF